MVDSSESMVEAINTSSWDHLSEMIAFNKAKVEPGASGNCNICGEVKPLPNWPNDSICADCKQNPVKKAFDKAWVVMKATRSLRSGPCQHCGKSERHPEKGYCIPCFEEGRPSKDSRKQSDVDDRYHGTECHCAACMSESPNERGY